MKLTLRPLIFISHFPPGFFLSSSVFLYWLKWDMHNVLVWIGALSNNQQLILIVFFLGLSFLAGEVLDSFRDVIFENVADALGWKVDWEYLFSVNKSEAKSFEENYFTWYVFNFNAALSLLPGLILVSVLQLTGQFWLFLIALLLLLADAVSLRMEMISLTKKKIQSALPHVGVFTRLKPSTISGIGVFAILDIPKGTAIFPGDENTETVEVNRTKVAQLSPEIRRLYEDFCPLNGDIFTCPTSFTALSPSWYLNESKSPNVFCGENLLFYALGAHAD